jgi:uncharacterized protein (DUF885 family)
VAVHHGRWSGRLAPPVITARSWRVAERGVARVRTVALRSVPALFIGILGCGGNGDDGESDRDDQRGAVTTIADTYVREFFATFPEYATTEGIATADHSRLSDNSAAGIAAWQAKEDRWLADVRSLDTAAIRGTDEELTYGFLREQLEASVGSRVCRAELWNVSPTFTGWQSALALVWSTQPVGGDKARRDAIARTRAIPAYLDNEIANLREGLKLGYTAPRSNVSSVIAQMDALLRSPPTQSPFYGPAQRDSTGPFRTELEAVIGGDVRAAIQRYRDFLASEYLPKARETVGVSANPQGAECYRAAVRLFTALDRTAEDIHQTGLREMEKIRTEAAAIGTRSFNTSDPSRLMRNLANDPRYTFRSREAVIAAAQAAVDRAEKAAPDWFGTVPKAKVVIQPFAPFQEKSAPLGQYNSPSDDGSRPGTYLINTYEPEKQSRAGGIESTAFHETYPGHHLQIAIAKERPNAHPITRYFFSGAFVEGWGLYSERLADEMKLFSADVDRVGLLSNEALRAARLVVDAGMHGLGWNRQRAIDYLIANTAESENAAASEVDRYIAVPGQATSYMLGNLEIRALRAQAERELGSKFDIKAFHDRVLENGGVTLAILRSKVERWIADTK